MLVNIAVTMLYTFNEMELRYGNTLLLLEAVTVAFFAVDYCLIPTGIISAGFADQYSRLKRINYADAKGQSGAAGG